MLADTAFGRPGAVTDAARDRGWIVRRGLLAADAVGLMAAFVITALVFGQGAGAHNHLALAGEYLLFIATLPVWLLGAKLHELYDRDEERTDHTTFNDFVGVLHVLTLGVWILYALALTTGLADPELPKALLFWALAVALVTSGRAGARVLCRRHPAYIQNTLILGADAMAGGHRLSAEERKRMKAIIGHQMKSTTYPQDRESLSRLEDKYIFHIEQMKQAGRDAGFAETEFINNGAQVPSYWPNVVRIERS